MKTQQQTSLEDITLLELWYSDIYHSDYQAYDNKKKCYCIITIPNKPTSWTHSITY